MFIAAARRGLGPLVLALGLFLSASVTFIGNSSFTDSAFAQRSTGTQPAVQDSPRSGGSVTDTLGKAKGYIESGQLDAAIGVLKNVIAGASGQSELAQAYLLLAATYMKKRQPAEAVPYLQQLLAEFPNSEFAGRGRLLLGTAQAELGNL